MKAARQRPCAKLLQAARIDLDESARGRCLHEAEPGHHTQISLQQELDLEAARLAFPAAQWHLFRTTGHMPQLERPEEFAEVVRKLLVQVTAA